MKAIVYTQYGAPIEATMKYKSILVTQRGGPETLRIVENDLRPPAAREVRVRVLAAAVSLPDVEARYGRSSFPPKLPFTPGYAIVGDVDAVGRTGFSYCQDAPCTCPYGRAMLQSSRD